MNIRCALLAGLSALMSLSLVPAASAAEDAITSAAKQAEASLKARVGVAVLDTGSGRRWVYHANERFPMASTFKTLACAALLNAGRDKTATEITIRKKDLQAYAPVTSKMVGQTASAGELCAITLRSSDNTAANKVVETVGGPSTVTAFLRSAGDKVTRLDRVEPELNRSEPGDKRDTTTPTAMVDTIRGLVLGSTLTPENRKQLTDWLEANEVGGPLLRAAIPGDWRIADRTGAGGHGTRGVVGVMWPPKGAPIVAAVYLTETKATMEQRNAAIADIGRAMVKALAAQ